MNKRDRIVNDNETYAVISDLKGEIITNIKIGEEDNYRNKPIIISCQSGKQFQLNHEQDCCEISDLVKIKGKIEKMYDSPIIFAEEDTYEETPVWYKSKYEDESHTWSEFTFKTEKATIKFFFVVTSNGYYSELISCKRLK